MLTAILYILLYIVIAVIVVELIFWILTMIFPATAITLRVRGLLYALILILVLIYALNHFGLVHM